MSANYQTAKILQKEMAIEDVGWDGVVGNDRNDRNDRISYTWNPGSCFLSQVDLQAVAQVAEQNLEASRSTENLWDLQGNDYSDNTMITIYYSDFDDGD